MPWVASSERVSNAARAAANPESSEASSVSSPTIPLNLAGKLTTVPTSTLLRRSMSNLLRMGHCAPTVMQTLLDASDTEAEWLVKLTAGLPGGIGNTGAECGGVTAPLVLIGLRHARDPMHDGLPPVIDKGHDLLQRLQVATAPRFAVRFAASTGCRCDALEQFVKHPNSARRRCRAPARM
jgi:hypothetical protein